MQPNGIKRSVVAYRRVSTLEQKRKGYGIDIQIRDLTPFAERQELFIERFYKDEAEWPWTGTLCAGCVETAEPVGYGR